MKVEIDLRIPDGYEFVRYGKMRQGEIGILPGVLHLHLQHNAGMYRNDYFIIKKKVKLPKTRRYLYEDTNTHREEVGLMQFNPLFQCVYPTLTRGRTVFFFKNQIFIKWLEDDWYEYKI